MNIIRWDDFDVVYDEILASRLKRKRFRTNIYSHSLKRVLEDHQQFGDGGMEDEDYMTILNHLGDYIESRRSRRDDGYASEEEEDCVDPQYQMFLDRLREDGKSYVLQIVINNNGSSLTVKYEADGGSDDKDDPPTLRKPRKVVDTGKKMVGTKELRNILIIDKMKTRKGMRNIVINETRNSEKNTMNWEGGERRNLEQEKEFEPKNRVLNRVLRNIPFTDKMKIRKSTRNVVINEMRNLEKNVRNCVGGERRNLVRQEEFEPKNCVLDCVLGNIPITDKMNTRKSPRIVVINEMRNLEKNTRNWVGGERRNLVREEFESKNHVLGNIPITDKTKTQKSTRNVMMNEMSYSKKNMWNWVGGERRILGREVGFEPQNRVSGKCSLEVEREGGKETDMVEESYQTFLNCIKPEGDCIVFSIGDGKQVKYEEVDDESSSDSELLVTYNASDFNEGNYNPFETSKLLDLYMDEDYQLFLGNSGTSSHFGFREKLMDKLQESYDHKEYEMLWRDINEQKPKAGRHRELRGPGVMKSYTKKDECSQSYLQQYTVLKRKIDEAQFDRRKVLNLLRGFFFWLQNLVYKDAFPPWIDQSCLEMMPRNSAENSASPDMFLPWLPNTFCATATLPNHL